MLEEDGYCVEVFRDGEEVLARFAHDPPPDAIVTDLVIPREGGIAVLGEARRRWSTIPVIFVTGYPELIEQATARFQPSPLVFAKPISYDAFGATLHGLFSKRGH